MNHPATYLRYLPVEGEIKVGDYYHCDGSISEGQPFRVDDEWGFPPKESHPFLVERYAVTTSFKIGDQITTLSLNTKCTYPKSVKWDGRPVSTAEYFSVLAPISPAVTWKIEDGAEIEVKELCELVKNEEFKSFHGYLPRHKRKGIGIYKVKGPCGHYH